MTLKKAIDEHFLLRYPILTFTNLLFICLRVILKRRGSTSNNVGLVSLHKIGDTVFTIPAIRKLVQNIHADITIICYHYSKEIYQHSIYGLKYLVLDKEDFNFGSRLATFKARAKLKMLCAGTIIDLTGSIVSASLIFNLKCNKIFGINEIYYKGIYDKFSLIRNTPHQIDIYFDAIKTFNSNYLNDFTGYPIEYEKDGTILIQPFAGWISKEWGISKYHKLFFMLSKLHKCAFIFPKNSLPSEIKNQFDNDGVQIIESESIDDLIITINQCILFISNDSGPLQIAALLGKPTFTIYGPTNPEFHLPYGHFHNHIRKILSCSPLKEKYCFADGGDSCPHIDCLRLLEVDKVFDSVNQLIHELKSGFSILKRNEK